MRGVLAPAAMLGVTLTGGAAASDPAKGGHTANGITETLLTGDTAAQSDGSRMTV